MSAFSRVLLLSVGELLCAPPLHAAPVPVRHQQGSLHAFLVLKDTGGTRLAVGDLVQVARGSRIKARLTFHFRDGSLDDELTTYTQRGAYKLLYDRHIQRGPSFPHPVDAALDVSTGILTTRFNDKDGHELTESKHFDLEADIANGLAFSIVSELPFHGQPVRLSYLAVSTAGGRLVHLVIGPVAEEPVTLSGVRHNAMKFAVHVDIGGLAGTVAPLIGKQPGDLFVWVLGGEVPVILATEGQLYEGGPVWRVELDRPEWPNPRSQR